MTPRRALHVGLLVGAALFVAGCSSGAVATPTIAAPTAVASAAPSAVPSVAPSATPVATAAPPSASVASSAAPGATPVASSAAPSAPPPSAAASSSAAPSAAASAASSPDAQSHAAPDLEAALPDYSGGILLVKSSFDGSILADDAASTQLKQFLAAHGKTPADFQEAAAADPGTSPTITFVAFRVPGVDAAALSQAVVSATVAANPDLKVSMTTVDGTQVVRGDEPSGVRYLWTKGDLVFGVQAINETLATQGFEQLK